ncbi:MAG: hypothetical protein RBS57_17575 [Desulforhabdus sp.]|jgi:hypothetical protein|nr:hypothetical protein [Desulforhabdus sp.]
MKERSVKFSVDVAKANAPFNLNDFVEYVENQAKAMEQSGWKEGHGLRKWVSELRRKSHLGRALGD